VAHSERLRYAWVRMRDEGFAWTVAQLIRRSLPLPVWLLLLPVTAALHLAGFRRLTVLTERVGHFAGEIDCFLKLQMLGRLPRRRYFVTAPPGRVSNRSLADYWSGRLPLVRNRAAGALLSSMSQFGLMRHDVSDYILTVRGAAAYYGVNADWGDRPALLGLTAAHRARGQAQLAGLGLPADAWFVCVHVREGGYSRHDQKVHGFRDAHVDAVLPAMRAIVERGGWCVRMGDPTTTPLAAMPGVIDYAHHPLRSPEMDVFLCASCRFFLGSSSGLFVLSSIFGVPCALANMVPVAAMPYARADLSIPKLLWSESAGRHLSLGEVLSSPLANYRMGRMFVDAGARLVDNTPEEIRDLALEMLDRVSGGRIHDAPPDPLQAAIGRQLQPWHYCYRTESRVAASFLRRHRDLLGV